MAKNAENLSNVSGQKNDVLGAKPADSKRISKCVEMPNLSGCFAKKTDGEAKRKKPGSLIRVSLKELLLYTSCS